MLDINKNIQEYAAEKQEELKQLIRDLCVIPAPSHHEEERAKFCHDWFVSNGFKEVYTDSANNVICPYQLENKKKIIVFMAHTDVVFPDTTPLPLKETSEKMYCPGVCDDTGNLAVLMIAARYYVQNHIESPYGILFVANSCEEGLGNLDGSRKLIQNYQDRIKAVYSFDGLSLTEIVTKAVGSHRYRITIKTEGGHSYSEFGKPNAIHLIAQLIQELYSVEIPRKGSSSTTYNVGVIAGGTSVNTIAQEAHILYEYRSDNKNCLTIMEEQFHHIIEGFQKRDIDITVHLLGERPCAKTPLSRGQTELIASTESVIKTITGAPARLLSGSTDCNIPLSLGIPAICVSVLNGSYAHTREEELDLKSLYKGCVFAMSLMSRYFSF